MSGILRRLVKSLVPPVALSFYRRFFPAPKTWIWEGSYSSFEAVPAVNPDYDYDARVQEMMVQCQSMLNQAREGCLPLYWHTAIATLGGVLSANGKVRVLDFGGALGTGFIQLSASLQRDVEISYDVVDLPHMCEAGRELFEDDTRIRFHTSLDAVLAPVDILYLNSVLQYIPDYESLLKKLASVRAQWILLARVASGDFPPFVARQMNLSGQIVPHWFLNRGDVVGILSSCGYRLLSDTLDNHQYDMTNYPVEQQAGRQRHMLFVRSEGAMS